jgi:hypothetical protein
VCFNLEIYGYELIEVLTTFSPYSVRLSFSVSAWVLVPLFQWSMAQDALTC